MIEETLIFHFFLLLSFIIMVLKNIKSKLIMIYNYPLFICGLTKLGSRIVKKD